MPDDNQTHDVATLPVEAQAPPVPISDVSSQLNGSTPTDLPPVTPESPTSDLPPIPVESQNGGLNESESKPVESPKESQTGFIRSLLIRAQAKIQSNRQKKLELLMQAVSKKGKIDNREAQKLLRISDKTAERYLNKLVTQGRLKRSGAGRDVVYIL